MVMNNIIQIVMLQKLILEILFLNLKYISYKSMIENDNESMIGTNSDYEDNGNENGPSADEKEEEDNIEENEKDADQLHEIQSGKVNPLTLDQMMDFNCHEPIGVIQGNQDTKSELPSKVINLGK